MTKTSTATPEEDGTTPVSQETKLAIAKEAFALINKAETKQDVVDVIETFYGRLGHKVINRMLLKQEPEQALRIAD